MKLAMMFAAGALAFGTIAATPAQAQGRYDRDRGGWDRGGWERGDRWHGGPDRRWQGSRYGYRGDYRGGRRGWNGGYGRPRVVCRIQRGYYGPVRRCFRVYR